MNSENSLTQFVQSVIGTADSELTGIGTIIVNLAEDLSKLLNSLFYVSSALGLFLFVLAILDVKKIKKANSNVTAGGVLLKVVSSTLMGQLATFVYHASQSLSPMANPMYPDSYVAIAKSQSNDPMNAMLFGVMAIITLLGWIYAFKCLYLFYTASNKDDKEGHILKAVNTGVGSILIVNIAFVLANAISSAGGNITQIGNFN